LWHKEIEDKTEFLIGGKMKYIDKLNNHTYTDEEIKEGYTKYTTFVPLIEVEGFVDYLDSNLYDIITDLERIVGLSEIDDIRLKVKRLYNEID
jgi:hypothetical protein